MKRSKKRKLKREQTFDYGMIVQPAYNLRTEIEKLLNVIGTYYNDLKLLEVPTALKYKIYRELLTSVEIRKEQITRITNILDECTDENGNVRNTEICLYNMKNPEVVANEMQWFAKLYEKMTELSISISDTTIALTQELNKAVVETLDVLKQEHAEKVDEFMTITARYFGCDVKDLESSMESILTSFQANKNRILADIAGQQVEMAKMIKEGVQPDGNK